MTSDPSNNHREYSPEGSHYLFQFKRSDVISVLKTSIVHRFVFFKCFSEPISSIFSNLFEMTSLCEDAFHIKNLKPKKRLDYTSIRFKNNKVTLCLSPIASMSKSKLSCL